MCRLVSGQQQQQQFLFSISMSFKNLKSTKSVRRGFMHWQVMQVQHPPKGRLGELRIGGAGVSHYHTLTSIRTPSDTLRRHFVESLVIAAKTATLNTARRILAAWWRKSFPQCAVLFVVDPSSSQNSKSSFQNQAIANHYNIQAH
mmetsp:Transcript_22656/g.57742  ORF Transcript_22656/g.57742 Transcript_22656/m.57742 type:complete len:145 (+) Transcript_22656:422-856(+)